MRKSTVSRSQELIPMNSLIVEEARELAGWNTESEVLSIYTVMQQLTDPIK